MEQKILETSLLFEDVLRSLRVSDFHLFTRKSWIAEGAQQFPYIFVVPPVIQYAPVPKGNYVFSETPIVVMKRAIGLKLVDGGTIGFTASIEDFFADDWVETFFSYSDEETVNFADKLNKQEEDEDRQDLNTITGFSPL